MADKATYLLMASYIVIFAGLFVCVFVAIWYMGREQATAERPATRVVPETPAPLTSLAPLGAPGSVLPAS